MKKRAAIIAVITACIFLMGCAQLRQAALKDKPSSEKTQYYYETLQADKGDISDVEFAKQLEKCADVIQRRLDAQNITGAHSFVYGSDSIRIELPEALADKGTVPEKVFASVTVQGTLEFKDATGETKLTGEHVYQAYPCTNMDQQTQTSEYVVSIKFDSDGALLFGKLTEDAYNNNTNITITLDGKTISTAGVDAGPVYGGETVLRGIFTADEASDLAMQIESGALPLPLKSTDCGIGISEDPRDN